MPAEMNPNLVQTRYRWRADDSGPNATPTWLADLNTAVTGVEQGDILRLRMQFKNNGTANATVSPLLQVQKGTDSWEAVDSSDWELSLSTHFTDGDAVTGAQFDMDGDANTFRNGAAHDVSNPGASTNVTTNNTTEYEYNLTYVGNEDATYNFRFTRSDGTEFQSYVILASVETVEASVGPPVITTTNLPNGTVSTAYSEFIAVDEGTEPLTWSIISGALPGGLSLNSSTGEISGTPTTEETANFTVEVEDADERTDSQALSIEIDPDPTSPNPPNNPSIISVEMI